MSEQSSKVQCPLCEGQGELSPTTVLEKFSSPELRERFDARIAEIAEIGNSERTATKSRVLDFRKEVHTWNQALPIWRRSPKE